MRIVRGDIYYADLSPVVGSEQGGERPVLVIQNDVGNHHSPTIIAAAITKHTEKFKLPTHVIVPMQTTGLAYDSVVLAEQLRTIDKSRLKGYVGKLTPQSMSLVNKALAVSIAIPLRA